MNTSTLTLIAAFVWAIVWLLLPDRVLEKRPMLKPVFFGLGILLGAAALFVLLTQHA